MERRPGVAMTQAAMLALPIVAVCVWLGATVDAFGMAAALQGMASGLALAAAVVLMAQAGHVWGALVGLVVYLAGLLLCLAEAISWVIQGGSFNERFFVHLDVANVPVSVQAYPLASAAVALVLVGMVAGALVALRMAARRRLPGWLWLPAILLVLLSVSVDASPRRLYNYFSNAQRTDGLAASAYGKRIRAMLDPQPSRPGDVSARPGRNLVFIYLESVERAYTDEQRFPGLTPNINRLRRQGLDFSGFDTFPGVTYTIAGLFSSQCGAPYLINTVFGDDFGKLGFVPNNDNTTASSFHPELACFGDVLHAAGYRQTFLSGVNLSFANKGSFFRMHGYDSVLGKPQIEALHEGKLAVEGWGLHDNDLFDEALAEFRGKQAAGKPFSIVLSTVDTHPPRGYMLPGCAPYAPIRNAMLDAVHCADTVLGGFLAQLSHEPGWDNTVVVVMSDHISMRNAASRLYPPRDQRKPLLFVLNAGHADRPVRMYHMDIAPTVLALMGVHSNVHFLAGADRSAPGAPATPLPADAVAKAVLRKVIWKQRQPPTLCAQGRLVDWTGKALDVGGWKLPVMLGGFPVSRIPPTDTLLVFVDRKSAQLQILPKGSQRTWLARARKAGGSVFEATPFIDDDGQGSIALDWLAPGGRWASLGKVRTLQDIHLHSPSCAAQLDSLASGRPGPRSDFSANFGTSAVSAAQERRPGYVMSMQPPARPSRASNSAFMFARMTDEQDSGGTVHVTRAKRISFTPAHKHGAMGEFDLSGLASFKIGPRIDILPGRCATRTDTGIVGVRLSLDGHEVMPRFVVDRNFRKSIDIPVNGARRLKVEVDDGNGTSDCDYFAVQFSDIAAASGITADAPLHSVAPN